MRREREKKKNKDERKVTTHTEKNIQQRKIMALYREKKIRVWSGKVYRLHF